MWIDSPSDNHPHHRVRDLQSHTYQCRHSLAIYQYLNYLGGGGWMRPRAFLLIRSQFSASAKTRQHGGLQPCCVFITVVSRLCKTSRLLRATLILIQHTSFSIHVTFVLARWLPHQRSLFEPDRVFLCT